MPYGVGSRVTGHGDPREPLGPEYLPTPALSPRQACDMTPRSCGNQPAYGSFERLSLERRRKFPTR